MSKDHFCVTFLGLHLFLGSVWRPSCSLHVIGPLGVPETSGGVQQTMVSKRLAAALSLSQALTCPRHQKQRSYHLSL